MKLIAIFIGVLVLGYTAWRYVGESYYKKPQYIIGAKNITASDLRDVSEILWPQGKVEQGILSPGQDKLYMDPRWPVPERLTVIFTDENGRTHEITLTTSLSKDFQGKIMVVISKLDETYSVKLETYEMSN
ncbi:MAG: hypothetical protein SFY80_02950 [Verrucomicrobiota bacterium]|nr:hypothetical protein [Verrucomicrobiota bacterium]